MKELAALTEICTSDVRDLVYQHAETGQSYEQIKEKIVGWTSNRLAASAAHMAIGHVDQTQYYQCEPCGQDLTDESMEVNYMAGKCFNCGQIGHPARLCPNKGKGKGGYQAAKGGGKGGLKGGGKQGWSPANPNYQNPNYQFTNPKGGGKGFAGKGYQGSCFTCGQKGHKAAECTARRTNLVEAEEEEVETVKPVGGVWLMGHVGKLIETHNRFESLTQEPEECGEDNQDWQTVTQAKKTRKFTSKSKINLTTRNLCNPSTTEKVKVSQEVELPETEKLTEKLIASAKRQHVRRRRWRARA